MAAALDELPRPLAVLFDLDGTLVDTVGTRIAAWERALSDSGYPTDPTRLAPLIGLDGKRLACQIATLAGRPLDEARAEEIDRESGEIYARLNTSPRPLPGVLELMDALESVGIAWAIATSSRKAQVAGSVAALGLQHEPTIVDASHVQHAKPEPDLLLLAANEMGIEPAACWYVGDSTWDMVSAVAAGMTAIGVTAGSAVDADILTGSGAAAVVGTLEDLTRVIQDTS